MIKKILNLQTKSVGWASLILAGSYFVSAALGLLRDRLLAGTFGAGSELDTYYAAFTVPDFIALILILGAISAAIIPIFSSYLVESKEEAWRYVSALLNVFLVVLITVCLALILAAPWLVKLVAPGFSLQKQAAASQLMRIMFLSPVILGVSNIMSGILQVFRRFLVTALAPLFYNLGIICGILFFVPRLGILGLAWGVVLGAVLHLAIQVPAFWHSGFRYRRLFDFRHAGVMKTLKLMVPRSLGLGAGQLNTIAVTAIASTLASGSIAIFNLANNLSSLLVNAVAVSLSTAIFPAMSLAYSKKDIKDFERKFSGALLQIVFLAVPASCLMFILRAQIVRVVLGVGKFGWVDTRLTAACLGIFAVGLCFQGLVFIISKTFYAAHNTAIPAIISAATVAFNISLSIFLVWMLSSQGALFLFVQQLMRLQGIPNMRVVGLVAAYTITAVLESSLLLAFAYKKLKVFRIRRLAPSLLRILTATVFMTAAAVAIRQWLPLGNSITQSTTLAVFIQLVASGLAGIVAYLAASLLFGSSELQALKHSFLSRRQNKNIDIYRIN